MARTVEDVLSMLARALLLGARASIEAAPRVAELMARELDTDEAWRKKAVEDYEKVAQGYVLKQDQRQEPAAYPCRPVLTPPALAPQGNPFVEFDSGRWCVMH
jgi:hypothetical protein